LACAAPALSVSAATRVVKAETELIRVFITVLRVNELGKH
jgi:hypothetical protein